MDVNYATGNSDGYTEKSAAKSGILANQTEAVDQRMYADQEFVIGSRVRVSLQKPSEDVSGIIRWIGVPPGENSQMMGLEITGNVDNKLIKQTYGFYNGKKLFHCNDGYAIFAFPNQCTPDDFSMKLDNNNSNKFADSTHKKINFGHADCAPIVGAIPPLRLCNIKQLKTVCGKFKGVQGHHNSCYLDATLFAMFAFNSTFDSLLYRPPKSSDIHYYSAVQTVLREEIVNPLRKNLFVRADRVMKFRYLLDQHSSVDGLTTDEKDPEEFLNGLLSQILHVEPFLKLSSGQDAYFYQLFVEKDEELKFPSVQQLFEQSFHAYNIKLKQVPSCLIIQMPRFGKNYKMYPRILPSPILDVTDTLENSPRQCSICGKLAKHECLHCFGNVQSETGLDFTAFCEQCLYTVHKHEKRKQHSSRPLKIPKEYQSLAENTSIPRLFMELFAVVCIETSHYVSFVKTGPGPDAPWCFFDSMADRKGEVDGFNIPEISPVEAISNWLSDDGAKALMEECVNGKPLPDSARRLFSDAYMCMYHSSEVTMYQ